MLLAKIIELMVNLVVNVGDVTMVAGGKNEMVVVGCRWSQQGASCKGMVAVNYEQPLLDDSTYPERRKEILKGEEVKELVLVASSVVALDQATEGPSFGTFVGELPHYLPLGATQCLLQSVFSIWSCNKSITLVHSGEVISRAQSVSSRG